VAILTGIDLQPVDEVEASLAEFGGRYARRLFTDAELECAGANLDVTASWLAGCFAAKEAVLKILDSHELAAVWRSIEVRRDRLGRVGIRLSGDVAEAARRQGVRVLSLSLSLARGVAVAAVVAEVATAHGDGS